MRRLLLPCIGLAALVAPAAASAETTSTDQSNAAKNSSSARPVQIVQSPTRSSGSR